MGACREGEKYTAREREGCVRFLIKVTWNKMGLSLL